jgi:hypothetical protein
MNLKCYNPSKLLAHRNEWFTVICIFLAEDERRINGLNAVVYR